MAIEAIEVCKNFHTSVSLCHKIICNSALLCPKIMGKNPLKSFILASFSWSGGIIGRSYELKCPATIMV